MKEPESIVADSVFQEVYLADVIRQQTTLRTTSMPSHMELVCSRMPALSKHIVRVSEKRQMLQDGSESLARTDEFYLSLRLRGKSANTNKLFEDDQSVEIHFEPFHKHRLPTGKWTQDTGGWKARFVDALTITHTGTHLVHVRLPRHSHPPANWADEFSADIPPTTIYLKLLESVLTAKDRLKALNALHSFNDRPSRRPATLAGGAMIDGETVQEALEAAGCEGIVVGEDAELTFDDEPCQVVPGPPIIPIPKPVDYLNQRAILQDCSLHYLWYYDFLGDIGDADLQGVLDPCTSNQKGGNPRLRSRGSLVET